ncbi:MAG: efflux RND transporter periplasmic adaptor subunit [Gammaproteobacteria bacterium]|nr:efflux RND transporter periplasmic adaptor subunit [Gammaproteobacteria bacterium]
MHGFLKVLLPVVFLAVAIGASFIMIQSRPEAMQKPAPPPSLLVSVDVAERRPVRFTVTSRGSVSPRTETTLVSEVAGQIVEVSPAFVSGGFFKRGDVLIRMDPRIYEANLKRARAEVAKAQTQVATEHALAGYALEDWERLQRLNAARGPASDLTLRKPQLQQALAELESKNAEYDKAREDLRRTVIRAPYDGMIREKIADVGQFVNVGAQLARAFAVDRAEVRLPLTQQDLRYLDLERLEGGGTLPVTLHAEFGDDAFSRPARVVRSEGVFDATSRVLYVVAQIDDPYDLDRAPEEPARPLRIGTFVAAEIGGTAGGDLFALPRHALVRGTTVWVVDEALAIHPREVDVVRTDDEFAYIAAGLADGERYVTTPIDQPLPGMKVRLDG